MNKYRLGAVSAALLTSLLLCSCGSTGSSKTADSLVSSLGTSGFSNDSSASQQSAASSAYTQSSSSSPVIYPQKMQEALDATIEDTNKKFADFDICMGNLVFNDAKDIPSQTLFTFYCYAVTTSGDYPDGYVNKWYDKKAKIYRVPISDINAVINNYFNGAKFDPAKMNGYNPKNKSIDSMINGFGGARFPKLADRKVMPHNTLAVSVDYYNEQYKNIQFTKTYTIQYTDTGYKFLSIKETKQ